jgi:hypothetical protein
MREWCVVSVCVCGVHAIELYLYHGAIMFKQSLAADFLPLDDTFNVVPNY